MTEDAADLAFIRHKSRHVVRHALTNARRLHRHPCATVMGKPLAGRTVLVVGAAPTRDVDGSLLRDAQKRGAVILAVNSSSPVLASFGVTPDAIVVRESIDMSADVAESKAPMVVLDVCAHPKAWDAAGDRVAWFIPGYPHTATLAEHTGAPPLFGGSAALTSAVKLAFLWGAKHVVLVGVSLSYVRGEGDVWLNYHPASPRGDSRSRVIDGRIVTEGNERDDERHQASGQKPPAKSLPCEWVAARDNSGKLPTISTMLDQKRWLESEAERWGERVQLRNATEGGAAIVGWKNTRMDCECFEYMGSGEAVRFPATYPIDEAGNKRLIAALTQEAELQRAQAAEILRDTGPRFAAIARLEGLHLGAPLPEALGAHAILDAPEGDPLAQLRYVYKALGEAATEAIGVLRGGQ